MLSYFTSSGGGGNTNLPRYLIIFLHGLGDQGRSWSDFFSFKSSTTSIHTIFPNAPNTSITLNGGMLMPGWYDIWTLQEPVELLNAKESSIQQSTEGRPSAPFSSEVALQISKKIDDVKGFEKSAQALNELILSLCEKYSLTIENIILGGKIIHDTFLCE